MTQLLITPTQVQEIAFSSTEQLRDDLISDTRILVAQQKYIRPVLGKLYDVIDNGLYSDFVDEYIKPALAFYVRSMVIDELTVSIGNMGAVQYKTATTVSATANQQARMRQRPRRDADALIDKATAYIEANAEQFSQYKASENVRNRLLIKGSVILQQKRED